MFISRSTIGEIAEEWNTGAGPREEGHEDGPAVVNSYILSQVNFVISSDFHKEKRYSMVKQLDFSQRFCY